MWFGLRQPSLTRISSLNPFTNNQVIASIETTAAQSHTPPPDLMCTEEGDSRVLHRYPKEESQRTTSQCHVTVDDNLSRYLSGKFRVGSGIHIRPVM